MIIVKKNNFLTYRKNIYRCSLGINGLSKKKVEGDQCTPVGIFTLGNLYVRTDKIKNLKTNFDYSSITKSMILFWWMLEMVTHQVCMELHPRET